MRKNHRIFLLIAGIFFVIVLAVTIGFGVQAWMRKMDPLLDVPSAEFYKTVNGTMVKIDDIIVVKIFIGWHGHVLPEFKRDVKVIDPFPEDCFVLVGGSNIYEYQGYGPGPSFSYSLKVAVGSGKTVQLPKPTLYLDGVEIPLKGEGPVIQII